MEVTAILRTIMVITMAVAIAGAAHGQRLPEPVEHYADWIETATIMQPWNLERTAALVEEREEWIPRLKQWGFDTVIFIPGPGDIDPDYSIETLRAAADDYHDAGMRVLMYWSIMHVGHHDTWHTVAEEHPEWWQRDAEGGTVTIYGDEWLCPSTGALEYTINLGIDLAKRMDADGIMLDNNEFYYTDAGATCYCEGCQEAFRAYIRGKLGDGALVALGLDPKTLCIPLPNQPLWGEWVDWRYIVWREATEQFRERVRDAMPGAILCANTQYKHNWVLAVQEQIEAEDLLFSESGNQLGREMACKLAYGHALADGKPVWNYLRTWKEGDLSRLGERDRVLDDLCTSLAWNTAPWIVGYGLVFQAPAQDWLQAHYEVPEGAVWLREETGGADGSPAVRLSSPREPARISVSHQPFIQVKPGQSFDFSIRYRTQRVRGGHPRVRLTFVDAAHKAPAGGQYAFYADGKGGTHGWQELTLTGAVAPEGAVLLNVEAFLWEATGSVWWDDARLTRDGEEVPLNGDFDVPAGEADARTRDALVSGLQFRREHDELYRGAVRWADVGLLLSRHSVDFAQAYNRFPRPTMHALLDAHVPFIMFEEHQLDAEHLARVKVLIAPQASCLGDQHLVALAEWVHGGGRLIFTYGGRYGVRGFGEALNGLAFDDEMNWPIYEKCSEHALPYLFDMGPTYCWDEVGLPRLERMMRQFPDCQFVGHGPGFWTAISGDDPRSGYPTGPITHGGAIDRLMADYDNLWLDMSAGSGHNAMTRDPEFAAGFIERHWRKMLFATDYFIVNQRVPNIAWFRDLNVRDEQREAIGSANALRLLGM